MEEDGLIGTATLLMVVVCLGQGMARQALTMGDMLLDIN